MDFDKLRLPAWLRVGLEWASGIAAWLGGFELVKLYFTDLTARLWSAQLYVMATAIGLALVVFTQERRTSRKEKYANITGYVQQASHQLRELETYIEEKTPSQKASQREVEDFLEICRSMVSLILDQLNLTFVSVTGTRCRTSIKLIYNVGEETFYYTLARDKGSDQICRAMDNKRIDENHDPLKKNYPFSLLLDPENNTWHYFSNNLVEDDRFSSTSFSAYDPNWGQTGVTAKRRFFRKVENWPLPYRSGIACTIRQSPGQFVSTKKPIVLGFVTVDSESRRVFSERWDVPIVMALANALYHPLKKYLQIQNSVNRATDIRTQRPERVERKARQKLLTGPERGKKNDVG